MGDIIQIPSENPPGDTVAAIDFMADKLREVGLTVEIYEPLTRSPNIVSFIEGASDKPTLILNGHIDQFPVENVEKCSYCPYAGS